MIENNKDQAELLREQMEAINHHEQETEEIEPITDHHNDDIDVLNLPPRKQVHDEKKAKFQLKINIAFVRFIAIVIFIIAILIFSYKYWGDFFLGI